jgi:tetratricopeptide (TPR) repeat protein
MRIGGGVLLAKVWAFPLLAAVGLAMLGPPAALAQTADAAPSRAVVEQKAKMLESILNAPKTAQIASSGDAEAAALVAQARKGYQEARDAMAAGDLAKAGALLDLAIKASSSASSRAARVGQDDALRARNRQMLEELNSYSASLTQAVLEKGSAEGTAAVQRIERLVADAAQLTAAGRHSDAGQLISEALNLSLTTVSALRAGQTVVLSLKFDTPADEYAYEQKRHASNLMLVEVLVRDGKVEEGRRKMLDRFVEESTTLKSQADQQAKAGDYPAAIKSMEKANDRLLTGLRASGLASF